MSPTPDPANSELDPSAAAPTRVRLSVLAFLCTLALLLYVDRVCIGQAETSIREEFGLTKAQMSWVFMAFTLAYCLFEVPTGHWGDRHGSRSVITRIVVWWSAFTALTGAALGLWSLLLIRFLFGAGEAGAFPNTARVVTRWFPVHERGRVRGAITTISFLGGAAAPILAAFLIQHVGWRGAFAVFGSVGIVWAVAFYVFFRDNPAEHPGINAAELAAIGPWMGHDAGREHLSIPWRRVLATPNVWLMGTIMMVSATLFYMQFQWYPTYLKEARGQSETASGWMTGGVMIGGALGSLFGGLLVDALLRIFPSRKWSRRLCGGGGLLLSALSVLGVRHAEVAEWATVCNASALFFVQLAIPTWWTVVAEISGRHGASMWGLMNSMGALGLIGTTYLAGWFVDLREQQGFAPLDCWHPVFDAVALGLAIGALCWMFVDATRSIVAEEGDAPPTI